MSEDKLVMYCSPTLASLKTGNLFSCPAGEVETAWLSHMNRMLVPRGLRLIPMKHAEGRVLLYLYRPGKLKRDLTNERAKRILQEKSYPTENPDRCVAELTRRMREESAFPHEIGLFLGYPPEDVEGFMVEGPGRAKLVGEWRVYGDVEQARETFQKFRKCTQTYRRLYQKQNSLEQLIVSAS